MQENIRQQETAFPVTCAHAVDSRGMTLRDWFAGQFMAALLAKGGELQNWPSGLALSLAEASYALADAMIETKRGSTGSHI